MASPVLKLFLWFVALFVLSVWSSHAAVYREEDSYISYRALHARWAVRYGRRYGSPAESEYRYQVFKSNVQFIEAHNASNSKYTLGTNQFADLTNDEFKAKYTGLRPASWKPASKNSNRTSFRHAKVTAPLSMDWRTLGAVTPIKSQEGCGCCWAFSVVAAVEGIVQIKKGKLVSLSEQELVDCNQGCQGGSTSGAYEFIIQNGGLTTEANYPYTGEDSTCDASKTSPVAATISGYESVPPNNEGSLRKAVAKQPVSVSIADHGLFGQLYTGGIFSGDCGTKLTHSVAVVGYGTADDGTKYWLVKNSWGSEWGENGYIRMQRDVGAKEGLCGIAMEASYPTIN